jgi:hypothetical protein
VVQLGGSSLDSDADNGGGVGGSCDSDVTVVLQWCDSGGRAGDSSTGCDHDLPQSFLGIRLFHIGESASEVTETL